MKLKRIITGVLAGVMCFGAFNVTSAFASDETNIFIVGDSTSCIYGYKMITMLCQELVGVCT